MFIENLTENIKNWIDVATYDYAQVLKNINLREVIAMSAQETRGGRKAGFYNDKNGSQGMVQAQSSNEEDKVHVKDI